MGKVKPGKQKDRIKIHIGKEERDWKNNEAKNVKQIVFYKFSSFMKQLCIHFSSFFAELNSLCRGGERKEIWN